MLKYYRDDASFKFYILSSNGFEVYAVNIYKDDKNKDGYVKLDADVSLYLLEVLQLRDHFCSIKRVEDIVQKLHGKEMEFEEPFSTYFQDELDNKNKSWSSIITIIPTIAGGLRIGKSRFLDKVEGLIKKKAEESRNNDFINMIAININYGNSTVFDVIDKKIQAQASLAIRILFECFQPQHVNFPQSYNFESFHSYCRRYHNNSSDILEFTLQAAL
ncbi:hypothetical protein RclHR1_01500006 [Rhizophagus clarus]|uniref:Uncharacterized protein n=1 Tax=Rhizophagus clarus TaxID=94130 RepID=A0A2Z6R6Q4_9GLOM|nr:hypothetical protein RclHR1_01500006 [Rhizophagus clarus]